MFKRFNIEWIERYAMLIPLFHCQLLGVAQGLTEQCICFETDKTALDVLGCSKKLFLVITCYQCGKKRNTFKLV
jgi:hypothetical protein